MSKESFPLRGSKFHGAGGVTPDQPNALADLLNELAGATNSMLRFETATLAQAGGAQPEIELVGQEWSDNVADYVVKIGKYDGAVDSIDKGTAGVTILTLAATPALTDYGAGEVVSVSIAAKKAGEADVFVGVGSLQVTLA